MMASCGDISAKNQRNQNGPTILKDASNAHTKNAESIKKGYDKNTMATVLPSKKRSKYADCNSLSLKNADEVSDLFEKQYPTALVDVNIVDEQSLTSDDMAAIVRFAACAAAQTDFEPFVADNASALFASKKHGNAAFAALEKISRNPGFEGKAAKEFAAQMRAYAEERTE